MIEAVKLVYFFVALGSILANAVFAFMAMGEIKKEVTVNYWVPRTNPFHIVAFHPEDLTEKGRKYRKLHFSFLGVFLGVIALSILLFEQTD